MSTGVPPSFWLDVAKAFLGSFFGAGFSLLLAIRSQRITADEKHLAAGNLALAVLSQQYGDYLISRTHIIAERLAADRINPPIPLFARIGPSLMEFTSQRLNLEGLSFLFTAGHSDLAEKLVLADAHFQDYARLVSRQSAAGLRRMEAMAGAGYEIETGYLPAAEIQRVMGTALVNETVTLVNAIYRRVDNGVKLYHEAGEGLRAALISRFGEEKVAPFRATGAGEVSRAVAAGLASPLP